MLQTAEAQNAVKNAVAMLETASKTGVKGAEAGFEFKCETTCQLVKKAMTSVEGMAMAGGSGPALPAPAMAAAPRLTPAAPPASVMPAANTAPLTEQMIPSAEPGFERFLAQNPQFAICKNV